MSFTNFWRLFNKFLHRRRRFLQLKKDIKKTEAKFWKADILNDENGRNLAEKRDSALRSLKRKMMKKPRG